MSSPIGVGIATAASLKRLLEKLTNGVFSACWIIRPAKPVQSTKKSAAMVSSPSVCTDAMSPRSLSLTSFTWQLLYFTPRSMAFFCRNWPSSTASK